MLSGDCGDVQSRQGDVQGRRKWGGVHVIKVHVLCKSSDVDIKPNLYSI